jgi:hypothetical protein
MRAALACLCFATVALVPACGSRSAAPAGTRTSTLPANAPDWARDGDQKTSTGSLFVCEGAAATEELAQRAALGTCSAKICELCGVEVKSTVTTQETLAKVDIERKVVETCRRVRKGEEEIRYKQSSCGPGGCTSFIQIFFSAESEARECKAYAEGNFADPAECERLIEEFRRTPGLDAASFRARVTLLDQAILGCADIDVRPTPKLTAMDEIVWQGVVSPRLTPWQRRRDDPALPLAERVRTYLADQATLSARERAKQIYRPLDRQPLRESKVFVDRLAAIRDAMRAYASIMALSEALAQVRYAPERAPEATALVAAMRDVVPFGKHDRDSLHAWVLRDLTAAERDVPGVKDFLTRTYPPPWSGGDARAFADFFAADDQVTDSEWAMAIQGEPCAVCLGKLVAAREHGGEGKRLARIVEAARKVQASSRAQREPAAVAGVFMHLDGDWLLRAEPKLSADVVRAVYTWNRLKHALDRLASQGSDAAADRVRKALAARLAQRLERDVAGEDCDHLDGKLATLEMEGQSTRRFEADLCRCLGDPKDTRRVGHRDTLYLRLIEWNASCVRKGGPS